MQRTITWTLWAALLTVTQISYAELTVDSKQKPRQVEKILGPVYEFMIRPYGDLHSADFEKVSGKQGTFAYENSSFAWVLNGKSFLSNIVSFTPKIAQPANCRPNPDDSASPEDQCRWQRINFSACHLFLFNNFRNGKEITLGSVTRLNIVRDEEQLFGLPRCESVEAMASAKTISDAMLITLGYIDSGEDDHPQNDPPVYYTTVLLRFSDENGKLKIEQDDSCLGNPNKYKTIADARKALAACVGVNPGKK